jgi:hypothetical protein
LFVLGALAMGAASARRGSALAVAAVVVAVMWAGTAAAAVYEVGDKLGWTIMNNPDYASWAKSKKFSVGDTIGTPPVSLLLPLTQHTHALRCSRCDFFLPISGAWVRRTRVPVVN